MKITLIIIGVLAAALLAGLFIMQRQMIYYPTHEDRDGRGDGIFKALRDSRSQLVGYVREAATPSSVVIFFHGNGGEAIHRAWIGQALPEDSVTVVLAEYPGYGAHAGEPSEVAIESAAVNLIDLVKSKWPVPLTVVGESLGTGVASYVAAHRSIERLALISPFTSLVDAASIHFPMLPVSMLLLDRFDSRSHLKAVGVPLRVIHGTIDDIVPFELGKRLFDSYTGSDKVLIELPGVGHNDIATPILHDSRAQSFRDFIAGR